MSETSDNNRNVEFDEIDEMLMEDDETTEEEVNDDDLAQDALDATEEESTEKESKEDEKEVEETEESAEEQTKEESEEEAEKVDPKDAVIGEFRRKLRDKELENARLEGELAVRKEINAPVAEVAKSPMELAEEAYIEEYGSIPAEGMPMTSKLYNEQRAFDAKQSESSAVQTAPVHSTEAEIAQNHLINGEFSEEKMGKGRDFESIISVGDKYLSEGDILDLKNHTAKHGKLSGYRQAYKAVSRRMEEAGDLPVEPTKKVKKVAKKAQKPVNNNNEDDVDRLLTQEDDTYTADSDSSDSKRLSSFITSKC